MAIQLAPPFSSESTPKRRGRPPGSRTHASIISRNPGIVDMVRLAFSRAYLLATLIGVAFGGFIPLAVYWIAHHELSLADGVDVGNYVVPLSSSLALVLGGLAFSALTVAEWARLAFGSRVKSLGFMVLLEGVMTTSRTPWLALTALVYLCAINAIASGVMLARGSRMWEAQESEPVATVAPSTGVHKRV